MPGKVALGCAVVQLTRHQSYALRPTQAKFSQGSVLQSLGKLVANRQVSSSQHNRCKQSTLLLLFSIVANHVCALQGKHRLSEDSLKAHHPAKGLTDESVMFWQPHCFVVCHYSATMQTHLTFNGCM